MSVRDRDTVNISSFPAIEEVIEKRLEEIVTLLDSGNGENGKLYDEVLCLVERCLIKIAMRRSNNIKKAAADFLGINRNTLHSKINKLDIQG
ncbi:MAG: Fis family transcriptional regulator [Deltaproteobacteria bacterium]|nr:Fis family transcriptional regulator [Deltaproteobacteria bacterium]